jgi:steroid delta-isomerase
MEAETDGAEGAGPARSGEELVERYLAAHGATDLEAVVALFAEAATLEDPVGSPPLRGREAIRAFYRAAHARNGRLVFERLGGLLAGGDELALHVRARLEREPASPGMDVIYTLRLEPEGGRILALRAFF